MYDMMAGLCQERSDTNCNAFDDDYMILHPPVIWHHSLCHALHQPLRHLLANHLFKNVRIISKDLSGPFDHLLGSEQGIELRQPAGYTTLQSRKLLLQVGFLVLARVSQNMKKGSDLGFVRCVSVPLLAEQGVGTICGQLLRGRSEPEYFSILTHLHEV